MLEATIIAGLFRHHDVVVDQLQPEDVETLLVYADALAEERNILDVDGWHMLPSGTLMAEPTMCPIPGGVFTMGDDSSRYNDEKPAHEVLVEPFLMMQVHVTKRMYSAVMERSSGRFPGDDVPVEMVSWYDAVTFCNKLSELCGLTPAYLIEGKDVRWDPSANGYRLPTEAEWEYAARGTDGRRYPWGDEEPTNRHARFSSRSPAPVGSYPDGASPFGVLDMAGNVWEWVFDEYQAGRYREQAELHRPLIDELRDASHRVLRGGCWGSGDSSLRAADRIFFTPTHRNNYFGFRCARSDARVQRGGGWYDGDSALRTAVRNGDIPTARGNGYGFRCARTADGEPGASHRGLRGGGWFLDDSCLRAADRYYRTPTGRYDDLGFRCARNADDEPGASPRVLRGGSWYSGDSSLRAACRGYDPPSARGSYGFRCARSDARV